MKKVLVFGTFDRLHPGHVNFFRQAKQHGEKLVVVVARDQTVVQVKNQDPKNSEKIRLENVSQLPEVDEVILGLSGDKHEIIRRVSPDVICLGYDQTSFTDDLENKFSNLNIVRLNSFRPEKYKSSKM